MNCKFKTIRNIKINPLQYILEPNNENNNSLNNITIVDLKDIYRMYRLSTSGLKKDLIDRISVFMESLAVYNNIDVDGSLEECEA